MNHSHHDNQHSGEEPRGDVRYEDLLMDLLATDSSGEDYDASHLPSFTASLYPRMPV